MDENPGAREASEEEGRSEARLCNLVAQGAGLIKGRISTGGQKELNGKDSEPWELIYFKVYKSQIPVIEQAIESAALMLGSDKSRGYCLEMICADFLAGASLDDSRPEALLNTPYTFPSSCQKISNSIRGNGECPGAMNQSFRKSTPLRLGLDDYAKLR